MSLLWECVSCRYHLQMDPDAEQSCLSCFNQSNWDPPKEDSQQLATDLDMLGDENDKLADQISLLVDENERLRAAYGESVCEVPIMPSV